MIKIRDLNPIFKILDLLFVPIMFVLGGFKLQNLQKTHHWHGLDINPERIDLKKAVTIKGSDKSRFVNTGGVTKHFGTFHMPIFGGWKNYIVLECKENPWHVGWISNSFSQIHLLPIKGNKVRVLSGKEGTETSFFAVDEKGNQIEISQVDQGKLGDNKYSDIPLY